VCEVSLDQFSTDGKIYIKNDYYKTYNSEEVIYRARMRIEEEEYNLFFNNCEHFVYYCTIGGNYSEQTEIPEALIRQLSRANRKKSIPRKISKCDYSLAQMGWD